MHLQRKEMIVSSLCQHFSVDPKPFLEDIPENDIKTLYSKVSKASVNGSSLENNDEVVKWIAFAESFPSDPKASTDVLKKLNDDLAAQSVISGKGFRPSEVDVIVFSTLHSSVVGLSDSDKGKLPHLMRWIDYIQNKENLWKLFGMISLEKPGFEYQLPGARSAAKMEADSNAKKTVQGSKNADKSEADAADPITKKKDSEKGTGDKVATQEKKKKATGEKDATQEKKKTPATEAVDKDKEVSVSLLNIQVGLIRKAWKHPSADSLLVEEIDVGDAKLRQVVSGLAKHCTPEELTNRKVVLITNVKPGKLRDVMSEGLVLCASNEDHTVVEPLHPPEGAKPGERVSFSGFDGKPEDVLNPKKKQLDKITPHLFTDDKGVATYKGIPFMTSSGPCTSSIPKASIK